MNVCSCDEIDRLAWSQFVLSHPGGNIFHTPEYYDLMQSLPGYEPVGIALAEEEKILGILAGVIQREGAGILGRLTARVVVMGGPLTDASIRNGTYHLLNDFAVKTGKRVLFSQYRNLFDTGGLADSFRETGYRFEEHLDIHIPLDRSPDEILKSFHPTRRKQIGRGYRRGLTVECDVQAGAQLMQECWSLLRITYKKAGLPVPPVELMTNAPLHLAPGMLRIFTARSGSRLAAFRMVLCYSGCIYDWYAASDPAHNDKYPNDILPWEVMRWGSLNGYKTFDFGGAGKPGKPYGVRDHKMKFGGTLVNYGRYERIHRPLLYHTIMTPFRIRRWFLNR